MARVIFDVSHDELVGLFGRDRVRRVPWKAAEAAGVRGEALRLLSEVGLPENDFLSFPGAGGAPAVLRTLPGEGLRGAWSLPADASPWIILGNFEISAIVLDVRSGEVHQLAEGVMRPIPLHRDLSSLLHTICRLTLVVQGLPEDYGDDEELLEGLEGTLEELKGAIAARDPRPFGDEHSEWVEIVTSIGAGMWG
ncbi:hypothetical protein OQI_01860 [Streptomyces pharetrae CZA14]|uniref:SUKH-4 immunity protein of toxin-antitoxin system n=1 Tax=Streptomyces pharetrae CZA14 TaxID=1144883 RepID=A0ABX3YRC7_9ACTN|nr:hypothetical protein OQI_01860 [Streptomyces pharetrae CZA14]